MHILRFAEILRIEISVKTCDEIWLKSPEMGCRLEMSEAFCEMVADR